MRKVIIASAGNLTAYKKLCSSLEPKISKIITVNAQETPFLRKRTVGVLSTTLQFFIKTSFDKEFCANLAESIREGISSYCEGRTPTVSVVGSNRLLNVKFSVN